MTEEINPFVDIIESLHIPIVEVVTPEVSDKPAVRDSNGRFVANNTANLAGRPLLKHTVSDQLRRLLDMTDEEIDKFKPKTGAQVIALKMYNGADDPQVLKELLNRTEGKVTDSIEIGPRDVSIRYEQVEGRE